MPLIKSTSKAAFGKNVAKEMAAGKPQDQAVAIAYSTKRAAAKHPSGSSSTSSGDVHSKHSADRSDHYHKMIAATDVRHSETKMTKAEHPKQNQEDMSEKGHKL